MYQTAQNIILFDGVCNLCNSSVQFVIRNDKKNEFKFASLQSEIGQQLFAEGKFQQDKTDSFVLISDRKYYNKSTAALMVFKILGGRFAMLYGLIVFPKFIRDGVYDFIAKNRYAFFGKRQECLIPTPELKNKFL